MEALKTHQDALASEVVASAEDEGAGANDEEEDAFFTDGADDEHEAHSQLRWRASSRGIYTLGDKGAEAARLGEQLSTRAATTRK